MILVDTSVLIDFFKGVSNAASNRMREILRHHVPFGITLAIYQELLQGAKSEKEYTLLKDYLSSQRFLTHGILWKAIQMQRASIFCAERRGLRSEARSTA